MLGKFEISRNRKTGCLPRRFRPGEVCPMLADRIDILDDEEIKKFIGKIDLRPCVKRNLDQDGVGSCAWESTTQGVMIAREASGQKFELLNPWFGYHHTSGGVDRGSSIDENLVFARDKGIAPESVWPRSKGWRAKPTKEAYEAAKKFRIHEFYDMTTGQEIKTALVNAFAVVYGWEGHSCIFTSLVDLLIAEYANSWGVTWGDKGFGRLQLSRVNFNYGAFAIRTVTDSGGFPE